MSAVMQGVSCTGIELLLRGYVLDRWLDLVSRLKQIVFGTYLQ